ncbi:MAG: hypothetical protein GY870_02050 [archaeon]|nr:hypothetical protein [archaeon]
MKLDLKKVVINGVDFYFSNGILLAVRYSKGLFIRKNEWYTDEMEKNISLLDSGKDKENRLPYSKFKKFKNEALREADNNSKK